MKSNRLFVPRLMDAGNLNAQNNNARNLLRRWRHKATSVTTLCYQNADESVLCREHIKVVTLWHGRLWRLHLVTTYFNNYDGIFCPGLHLQSDLIALRIRKTINKKCLVIGTLEGLVGDKMLESEYSEVVGHPVYCHDVGPTIQRRSDALIDQCDHVIAISPFLARLGEYRFGKKFSVLPLGVDLEIFRPSDARAARDRPVVVTAGTLYPRKRPGLFLRLAKEFPNADFRWFGDGELREQVAQEAKAQGLKNIEFPGAKPPLALAREYQLADVFVLTSVSEGVPKVSQEAAACGLPVILFGFYEAPTVLDGINGYVVWSDEEMLDRLRILLSEPALRHRLGIQGSELAKAWDWNVVAPKWEEKIQTLIRHV